MPAIVINGAQWGDEGKGKLVDCLTASADWVVRFQGGHNAGHTLVVGGKTTKLSLTPCGILHPQSKCLIGAGVVVRPSTLISEIESLQAAGVKVGPGRLVLDNEAQLLLSFHASIDQAREGKLAENKIGTTGRGIGPAHEDRASRVGIRCAELCDLATLKPKVQALVDNKQLYLSKVLGSSEVLSMAEIWAEVEKAASILVPLLGNGSELLNNALDNKERVVFEGAQATLLDGIFGTFPFVTSSSTVAGTVCTGAGVGPRRIDYVLGVTKAYCTRVGEGPFPTQAEEGIAQKIRERGREFGTVTGRPRRCGWLDIIALKRAARLNGYDSVAVMKLDVLSGFDKVELGVGYKLDGKTLSDMPPLASQLDRVEVQYESFEGWQESLEGCRNMNDLPPTARHYLKAVEEYSGCKLSFVSVGPDREQIILASEDKIIIDFFRGK